MSKCDCDCYSICNNCIKFKTMNCPNSSLCLDTENKPYFASKEELPRTLKSNQIYRHYMGKKYMIVGLLEVKENGETEQYVMYRSENNKRRLWARPAKEFLSEVTAAKYLTIQKYKFERIK